MRRALALPAALVLALGACGSDDEDRGEAGTTTSVTMQNRGDEREVIRTEPARTATQPTRTLDIPEPDLLGEADTQAVDRTNELVATVCDAVANGREPTETQVRDLASGLSDLGRLVRASPDAIWRPPLRPENERTIRTVAEEAIEVLSGGCLPEFADRLEQQIG